MEKTNIWSTEEKKMRKGQENLLEQENIWTAAKKKGDKEKEENINIEHDLARLCFMLYTPSYGNSQ